MCVLGNDIPTRSRPFPPPPGRLRGTRGRHRRGVVLPSADSRHVEGGVGPLHRQGASLSHTALQSHSQEDLRRPTRAGCAAFPGSASALQFPPCRVRERHCQETTCGGTPGLLSRRKPLGRPLGVVSPRPRRPCLRNQLSPARSRPCAGRRRSVRARNVSLPHCAPASLNPCPLLLAQSVPHGSKACAPRRNK